MDNETYTLTFGEFIKLLELKARFEIDIEFLRALIERALIRDAELH